MTRSLDRILRMPEVLRRTGLSRATVYRKQGNGTFPAAMKVSTRCVGWPESAVETWLRNRKFYNADEFR